MYGRLHSVEPKTLRPYFCVDSGGETETCEGEIEATRKLCREKDTKMVTVIDAKGQHVCFAAHPIAERIVELLNEDCTKNPKLYGV